MPKFMKKRIVKQAYKVVLNKNGSNEDIIKVQSKWAAAAIMGILNRDSPTAPDSMISFPNGKDLQESKGYRYEIEKIDWEELEYV